MKQNAPLTLGGLDGLLIFLDINTCIIIQTKHWFLIIILPWT